MQLLAEQVHAAKAGNPLTPVTVAVPGNYAAVATRRELARRGGVAAVAVLTLHRMAERLGGPSLAAAGRRPVLAPVVVQAVRAALDDAPGVFAPVAAHPATELALPAVQRDEDVKILRAVPSAFSRRRLHCGRAEPAGSPG